MQLHEIEDGISAETLAQLRALALRPDRPLIAVDVDEVLVIFVDHLRRHIRTLGYEMHLVTYQLEGSIFPIGSRNPLPFDGCIELINDFFRTQTLAQAPVPGGEPALTRLARDAQVVILTNVPRHATAMRRANLDALGIHWPMVVNSGGKGRAMAWLAHHVQAPCAFVDDSFKQVESVAKYAPDTIRLHFAWAGFIRRMYPDCEHATVQVHDWDSAETELRQRVLQSAQAAG